MATTKKDLYVGTDKHRWWKEAVIYQVCRIRVEGEAIS
jgi:oligo-1,6-glucosidase